MAFTAEVCFVALLIEDPDLVLDTTVDPDDGRWTMRACAVLDMLETVRADEVAIGNLILPHRRLHHEPHILYSMPGQPRMSRYLWFNQSAGY